MKAAILTIGTEILFGQIVNTNATYLSKKLQELGIDVMAHHTVGDNPGRVRELVRENFEEADLIITTGGLGPTEDDLTKEMICEVLETPLYLHEESLELMKRRFDKLHPGRGMTENNVKQAYMPEGALVLRNDWGTAPGFILEKDGKTAIALPGPPRENMPMFETEVLPYLKERQGAYIVSEFVKTIGVGESSLETMLMDIIDAQTDPTIATYAGTGECYLRVTSKRRTEAEAEAAVSETVEIIKERLGDKIYSISRENEDFYGVVGRMLIAKGISVSACESCTGGLFSGRLTEIAGISEVFDRGLVTYSNRAKTEELGVRAETLEKYGAVSEETAREMALGLWKKTGSRLCLSVTGIAGPGGGTEEKPVGLVYMAAALDGNCVCERHLFNSDSRSYIRERSVIAMFLMAYKLIRDV